MSIRPFLLCRNSRRRSCSITKSAWQFSGFCVYAGMDWFFDLNFWLATDKFIFKKISEKDNNSTHTSRFTRAWFARNPEINLINAPVNSPDLNPIENFWAEITREWVSVFPRNMDTLHRYVIERWEDWRGRTNYFERLYDSMPQRINAVIDNNGGITKY